MEPTAKKKVNISILSSLEDKVTADTYCLDSRENNLKKLGMTSGGQ